MKLLGFLCRSKSVEFGQFCMIQPNRMPFGIYGLHDCGVGRFPLDEVNKEIFLAKPEIKRNIKYEANINNWEQYMLGVEVGRWLCFLSSLKYRCELTMCEVRK